MLETSSVHPRLRLASIVVIGFGLLSLALYAGLMVVTRTTVPTDPRFWLIWVPRAAAVPLAYVWLGLWLGRGSYGAMVALVLVSSAGIADRIFGVLIGYRPLGVNPATLLILAVPVVILMAALSTRDVIARLPDGRAVEQARRRATLGLRIAGAVLILAAGALIFFAVTSLGGMSPSDRWARRVGLALTALVLFASISVFRMSAHLARGERLSLGSLIFAFITGIFIVLVAEQLPYGFLSFDFRWVAAWLGLAVNLGAVWLGTDLIHARRSTIEPQSYGFAPIMATTGGSPP